jgi:hypothetical protein
LEMKSPVKKPKFLFSTQATRKTLIKDSSDGMLRLSPLEGVIFK